jgi:OOP family OmpA-OmpF porin
VALGTVGPILDTIAVAEVVGATATEQPFTFSHSDVFKSPAELFVGARGRVWGRWGVDVGVATGITPPFAGGYGREFFRILIGFHYDVVNNDRDGDGIPDDIDRCPDQPGLPEHDGCPDRDGDDVPDIDDKCPDEAGPPENDGCPVHNAPMVAVEATRLRLRTNIRFETGSANIDQQSYGLLDEVAKVLKDFPQIELVRIEGHTDNRGSHAFNQDLSSRRAAAVLKYLREKGIDPKRMEAIGHSFDIPIAPNATPLGRAKNRRVEFRLIRVGGRPVEDEERPKEPAAGTLAPAPGPAAPSPAAVAPAQAPGTAAAPASPNPVPAIPDAGIGSGAVAAPDAGAHAASPARPNGDAGAAK